MSQFTKKYLTCLGTLCGGALLSLPGFIQPGVAQQLQPQAPQRQPQQAGVNPCPRIYYEPPFNTNTLVPAGCPPNAISQQLGINQQTAPPGVTLGESGQLLQTPQQSPGAFNQLPPTNNPGGNVPGAIQTPQPIVPGASAVTPGQVGQPGVFPTPPIQPPLPEQRSQAIANVTPINNSINVRLLNMTNVPITFEVVGQTEQRVLQGREEAVLQNLPLPTTITTLRQDEGFIRMMPMTTEDGTFSVSLQEEATPLEGNQGVLRIQANGQVFIN